MALFTNQATLSYNDNVVNSNIVTGEIVQVLTVSKTALSDTYERDKTITYIVNIVNSSDSDFTNLSINDNLGEYSFNSGSLVPLTYVNNSIRYFINGDLQTAPTVTSVSPLIATNITVPANGNATVVYSATANEFAPLDVESEITNTVTVNGASLSSPITANETITLETGPILSITKALCPLSVPENGALTYTFVIRNTGFTEADNSDDLVIRDVFDPRINITSVILNGVPLSSGTDYTYDQSTGEFVTVAGKITVPAATFVQDSVSGAYSVTPGATTLTVTGTV
ncbi:MAG TPA: hypothetical protein DCS04_01080 [Ruminococcaceae bacterium]|nr:hypothetical protein [Oscillospiraceae bacterium]